MIDFIQNQQNQPLRHDAGRAVLRYREEDMERTAGSMPVWERPAAAQEEIAQNLDAATAQNGQKQDNFASALSYAGQDTAADGVQEEEFGFGDLADMINPLQHIPLINHLYRNITGDEISPAARIIGGSIYGGPIGGATALANVAVEYETGKDVAGNVLAMVTGRENPDYRTAPDHPEQRLAVAARSVEEDDGTRHLPGSVLSFADLGGGRRRVIERFTGDDMERTAGTMVRRYIEDPEALAAADFLPAREPITTLSFTPMTELKTGL